MRASLFLLFIIIIQYYTYWLTDAQNAIASMFKFVTSQKLNIKLHIAMMFTRGG